METITEILAIALLILSIATAAGWLLGVGVNTPAPTKTNRRRSLIAGALSLVVVALSAIIGDWVFTVTFVIWAAMYFAYALAPDLPDLLRTRPG